ncbi:MAG: ABC transporter ATP-binding protein [Desulfatibacillaceae bacterium]
MIEAKGLTRWFGQNKVVDNVSFTVEKGEILGFLGPNAAGKSTTMRMITGYLAPSSGKAFIGGHDTSLDALAARRLLGYLPENAPVYADMTVTGFLGFIAEIRGFAGKGKKQVIERTIEKCFLTEVRDQAVSTLSKGFKQRVCFAQSILHDPPYLIMDEPTDGLDPNQKHEVRTMIREMGREKAIILSTHILEEVDAACTRAIVISRGRIVADDTPDRLRRKSVLHGAVCVTLQCEPGAAVEKEVSGIPGVARVEVIERTEGGVKIRAYPEAGAAALPDKLIRHLTQGDYMLESLTVEAGRLDEVFRNITSEGDRSAA